MHSRILYEKEKVDRGGKKKKKEKGGKRKEKSEKGKKKTKEEQRKESWPKQYHIHLVLNPCHT